MRGLKTILRIIALLIFAWPSLSTATHASTMNILYSFCSVPTDCQDGESPYSSLLSDGSGGFYGTTIDGGPNGGGEVFHLTQAGGVWSVTVLYGFCSGCEAGSLPYPGVIQDAVGNLYGVTDWNGSSATGTVFELVHNKARTKWRIKLLYTFCSELNCGDGAFPLGLTYVGQASGAPYDGTSSLYGTTDGGGANGGGIAFSVTPNGKKWKFKDIHDFGAPNTMGDGVEPTTLMADAAGNLFTATQSGGAHGRGAVVKLAPTSKRKFTGTVAYSFCSQGGCTDGANPMAGVVEDGAGNLFGTTSASAANNAGGVFELKPNGESYTFSELYSFCSLANCADGLYPAAPLTLDAQGDIYGTTIGGGDINNSGGVVFTLNPGFHLLYTFCSQSSTCKDGENPQAALSLDANGNIFGLTPRGGAHNTGEMFEISQ